VDCARVKLSLDFEVIVGSLLSSKTADMIEAAESRRIRDFAVTGDR
jgi:hypothetical protein